MRKVINALGAFVLDTAEVFAIAAAIFAVMYLFLAQPHNVEGKSMEPNFHNADHVLTDKLTYRFREPRRGEVIIFKYPRSPRNHFIKRVVVLPGETFEIKEGSIYIYNQQNPQGFRLDEEYLKKGEYTKGGTAFHENVKIQVPEEKLVVLGDNRQNSSDSREWGFVPYKLIIGRTLLRYWPPKAAGILKTPDYNITPISFLPPRVTLNETWPRFLAKIV